MEIRVLRYFLTIVQEKSINKAAGVLHITQPTLSRQIAQLEEEVGVRLFRRGGKGISLTEEGILLRRRAEEILSLVDKTRQELQEQDELIEGTITLGCGETAAVEALMEMLRTFHQKHPMVKFDIFTANADLVTEQMDKGLVDIGLLMEPVDVKQYEFIRLGIREKWVAVMRADDPLTEKETVTAKDLTGKKLILPRRMNLRSEAASWLGESFEDSSVYCTCNLSTNSTIMVEKGMGYSLVVEGSLPFLDFTKITYRPLSPEISFTSVLAWKRQQPFSPAASKLIEHFKTSLDKKKQTR